MWVNYQWPVSKGREWRPPCKWQYRKKVQSSLTTLHHTGPPIRAAIALNGSRGGCTVYAFVLSEILRSWSKYCRLESRPAALVTALGQKRAPQVRGQNVTPSPCQIDTPRQRIDTGEHHHWGLSTASKLPPTRLDPTPYLPPGASLWH